MYARRVSIKLKPDTKAEFTRTMEKEILPLLRKQKGFKDEMSFVTTNGKEGFAISLWDSKASAESYDKGSFEKVTKLLSKVIDGAPQVKTYDVVNSTFHKIGAALKAA